MRRFQPELGLPLPSISQVLWRSGCPADRAGPDITASAELAIGMLSSISSIWCGAVLFESDEVPFPFSGLFPGKPLSVMAVTLGEGVSSMIQGQTGLQEYMNDSAASVAVDSYMKKLQLFLAEELGMTPTKRIAPGYGEIPLSVQKDITGMFPHAGITCTDEYMLSPVKSMTGVVGWIQQAD